MLPDKASLSGTYGGPYTDAHPVEDPTTDLGASLANEALCDTAMMTHTALRAWVLWTGVAYSGSGTDSIVATDHDAVWGSGTSVKPTIGQSATGVWVVTWAATQVDEIGTSHGVNIRFPNAMAHGVDGLRAKVISWTANTITLSTYSGGAANALVGTKIGVWFI